MTWRLRTQQPHTSLLYFPKAQTSSLPFKTDTEYSCDTFSIAQKMGGEMKYQLPRSCMKGQQCRDDVKGQDKTYWGEVSVTALASPTST